MIDVPQRIFPNEATTVGFNALAALDTALTLSNRHVLKSCVVDGEQRADDYFVKILEDSGLAMKIRTDCHLDVPCRAIPYEPTIVLTDGMPIWI